MTAPRPEAAINGADAIAGALQVVGRLVGPDARRVIGWATVELDRAEREVASAFAASGPSRARDVPDDVLLGARCRLLTFGSGERELLLLEPATEGRIAASLARFGEGPVAVYLIVPAPEFGELVRGPVGLVLSTEADGPFGQQRLVTGGSRWGAHLCVAQSSRAATIEP